jgi:hypothetical protein
MSFGPPRSNDRDASFVEAWIAQLDPVRRRRLAVAVRRRRDPELLLDLCASAHGLSREELAMLLPECRAACRRWLRRG